MNGIIGSRLFAGLILAALWFGGAPALAQEIAPSHLDAARQAIATTRVTARFDAILPNLSERAKEELIRNRPDAAEQLTAIVDGSALTLASRRGNLEDEVARLYATIFTEEDLKALHEFYSSPAGQKLLEDGPKLAVALEEAARVWAAGLQRDLMLDIRKKLAEAGLQ